MFHVKQEQRLYYILRIASAMCFIGHGAFGIITKEIWTNYFEVFGIGREAAYHLMPVVGSFDILMGLILLIYPMRIILLWLLLWGTLTALMRPLSGEPFAEFMERAGNFGSPLALLLLLGCSKNVKSWFALIHSNIQIDAKKIVRLNICLRIVVFLILFGHGFLNILEKKSLLDQYTRLGFSSPVHTAQIIGITEMLFASLVLIKPLRPVIFALFIWKMFSELFYPNYDLFEWVERGGSYGALFALWVLLQKKQYSTRLIRDNLLISDY